MATLSSGDLSFEFNYSGFEYGWVEYQFYFRWKGESLISDHVLKRMGSYWGNRPQGALLANDHGEDGLRTFLKSVLETSEAGYWEPLEPDIIIAIYPEAYFPFLPSHSTVVYESEQLKTEREARAVLKEEVGHLPDDLFTVAVFVDAYNFKEADAYHGAGLALHLVVSRQGLEAFLAQLETEYQAFKARFKVDAWLEENA